MRPPAKSVNSWLENQLPEISRLARFNLAMARMPISASPLTIKAEKNLSTLLEDSKSSKSLPWYHCHRMRIELSSKVLQILKWQLIKSLARSRRGLLKAARAISSRDDISKVQRTHYMIYLSFMGINPILQFIKSEKPSRAEINWAATQILKNLENEKSFFSRDRLCY